MAIDFQKSLEKWNGSMKFTKIAFFCEIVIDKP
jgi:hypothetical protein